MFTYKTIFFYQTKKSLCVFIKYTFQYIYNIFYILSIYKKIAAQQTSQHCTKLWNEVHDMLHNEIYLKNCLFFEL